MVQRVAKNSSGQQPNSYVNLFRVAQYNLTLWILEENTSRIKKKQKRFTRLQS